MRRALDWILLAAAAAVSLSLLPSRGTEDVELWRYWTDKVLELGFRDGYAAAPDSYPPGCAAMLLLVAHAARALGISRFAALKWSLWLGLAAATAVAGLWTRSPRWAAAVHVGLLLNVAALGYLDIYFGAPLLLSLLALRSGRIAWAGLAYGIACSFKWQPLIAGPALFLYLALAGGGPREAVQRLGLFALGALAPLALAYAAVGDLLTASVTHAMSHPFLSGNALNLPWLAQAALHVLDPATYGALARGPSILAKEEWLILTLDPRIVLPFRLLFLLALALALLTFLRSRRTFADLLRASTLSALAYFILNTGVHENHSFPFVTLSAALGFETARGRTWYALWALAANLNLFLFYGLSGEPPGFARSWGDELSLLLAACNVALFAWTLRGALRRQQDGAVARS